MIDAISYPQYFFLLFGIISLIFLVRKPQFNFLLGVFYFSARELRTAAFTRLEFAGPYLNLDDFIILIIIISLFKFSFKNKILFPLPVIWLGVCFFGSILIISLQHSFTYEVQREHKAALYFILAIFLSYNFIKREKELEYLLKILFIGAIIASIQYILLTQERIGPYGIANILESIRSVGFIGLIPAFMILSFFLKLRWLNSLSTKIFYFAGLSFFLINLLLSQTRSYYISIILTIILIFLLIRAVRIKSSMLLISIVPFLVYIIFDHYLNLLNINDLFFGRIQLLSDNPTADLSTAGRIAAIKYEFAAFLSGNIILGNGLGFTFFLPDAYNPYIAWGHVGHIAYLSRLGLLGFIVYSIFIPYSLLIFLLRAQKKVLKDNFTKIFLIFATAIVIGDWLQFWMSASYLNLTAFLPGTIIGIVWAVKDKRIKLAEYQA